MIPQDWKHCQEALKAWQEACAVAHATKPEPEPIRTEMLEYGKGHRVKFIELKPVLDLLERWVNEEMVSALIDSEALLREHGRLADG